MKNEMRDVRGKFISLCKHLHSVKLLLVFGRFEDVVVVNFQRIYWPPHSVFIVSISNFSSLLFFIILIINLQERCKTSDKHENQIKRRCKTQEISRMSREI